MKWYLIKAALYFTSLLALCSSCSISDKFNDEYKVGTIESTDSKNIGYVNFYDSNGNSLFRKKLDIGGALLWNAQKVFNNFVYIGATGLYDTKDAGVIYEINKNNGDIKKYKIWDKPITAIAVSDSHFYATGNLNWEYEIISYEKSSGTVKKLGLGEDSIFYMEVYGDYLYTFVENLENHQSSPFLYIVDIRNMTICDKISLQVCGSLQLSSCMIGNELFFTNNRSQENSSSTIISSYNIDTKEISNYDIKNINPYQIKEYNGNLLISHFDPITSTGNGITMLDLKSQSFEYFKLNGEIDQFEIYNDKIFVATLTGSGRTGSYLSTYDMENMSFGFTDSFPLNKVNDKHYYSNFFVK